MPTYVLVTAARNEEAHIELTIKSVLSQTQKPRKWAIVSDESTDRTDDIVKEYSRAHNWIDLVRFSQKGGRNFARKAHCFRAGYEEVRGIPFDIVGNLDGDVSFGDDYMEYLLGEFAANPGLGVAGTPYIEGSMHSFRDSYVDVRHVHGQIQFFRKACFDEIGGYTPIPVGGIDWVAVTAARMKGWETRSFQDRTFTHHRAMGSAGITARQAQYRIGRKDYFMGNHPVWELFRAGFQMTRRPYVVHGLYLLSGYLACCLKGERSPIPRELVTFHRREQMARLRELISVRLNRKR